MPDRACNEPSGIDAGEERERLSIRSFIIEQARRASRRDSAVAPHRDGEQRAERSQQITARRRSSNVPTRGCSAFNCSTSWASFTALLASVLRGLRSVVV